MSERERLSMPLFSPALQKITYISANASQMVYIVLLSENSLINYASTEAIFNFQFFGIQQF